MPFQSLAQDSVLTPEDLDFLQDVYEAACAGVADIDDATTHEAVQNLIGRYRAGERDKDKLIILAARDLLRAGN